MLMQKRNFLAKKRYLWTVPLFRPAGKEAYLSARAYILPKEQNEEIIIDFAGVDVLAPSWGDEFISRVMEDYPGKVSFEHTENLSAQATLDILKKSSPWPEAGSHVVRDRNFCQKILGVARIFWYDTSTRESRKNIVTISALSA